MKNEFLHRDLKKIFPWISPRTLMYWSERGLLQPSITNSSGKGSNRRYAFRNLIEISFMSELLRRGLPYSAVKGIIDSEKYQKIIKNGMWDYIYWQCQQVVPAPVPMDKEAPYATFYGFAPIEDFQKKGGSYLFGIYPEIKLYSSIIIISFYSLKNFVDKQIEKL